MSTKRKRGMKITQLTAENVKRLQAVKITPDGSTVVIGGKNGEGKSSVLDSIAMALGGAKQIPGEPIRKGEKNAQIVLDIDDLRVTRRFTPRGSTLKVESKDGEQKSPQAILDKLYDSLSFDPLAFCRQSPRDQRETLAKLVGVDTDEFDAQRKQVYDDRTATNRRLKDARAELRSITYHTGVPDEAVSLADLVQELERRRNANAGNKQARDELEALRAESKAKQQRIRELQAKLDAEMDSLKSIVAEGKRLAATVSGLRDEDTDDLMDQIQGAEETNAKIRENADNRRVAREVKELERESESATEKLAEIDAAKADAIASADYPVPGLSVGDDCVILNGIPFDQASQAEQIRVSVAIGLGMNPKLRVMLIRDGSLLDEDSLAAVAEIAEASDAQLWIERVSTGDEVSVVIEDGMVRG